MLLIGLFAHYSWNKETGLENGAVFHGSLIFPAVHALLLFGEKYTPGDTNAPSR